MKLNEVLVLRISTELKQAVDEQARRLKVRSIDVIRMAIAQAVCNENNNNEMGLNQYSRN